MTTRTRPYNVKQSDLTPEWHVIDAEGKTLGRVASEIATLLQGKHKPTYTPHLAAGDFVVVVNAASFRVSGNKRAAKMYYRHSGYHGGLTEQTLEELLAKHPTRALRQAVKGMLPKNIRGKHMLSRLKLYEGGEHPHQAQVSASRPQQAPVERRAPEPRQWVPAPEAAEPDGFMAEEPIAEVIGDADGRVVEVGEVLADGTEQPPYAGPEMGGELVARDDGTGEDETEDEPAVMESATASMEEEPAGPETGGVERGQEMVVVEAEVMEEVTDEDLESLTVPQLREMAEDRGITLPSRALKADIIEALRSADED